MNRLRRFARLAALVLPLAFLAAPPAPAAPPRQEAASTEAWLYRGSDVPQDREWQFGTLANGVRYAVRRNGVPPGQVSIRILMEVGSLYETDEERGFAHLLEHLVFRQSKYLGEAQAIPTWQRLGASFGSDTNAESSPTQTVYKLDLPDATGAGRIEASLVDAGNACVFVRAPDLGLAGTEPPQALEADRALMERLLAIRAQASVMMGIAPDLVAARARATTPSIGIVAPPAAWTTLAGEQLQADACDLSVRMLSSGQPHRALPLTASVCIAVAAQIEGTLVHAAARKPLASPLRLGMPSGVLTVAADVERRGQRWHAARGAFYRTARRLFEGLVSCG